MKKVLVFLAKGFETMEFSVFIDILGWARNDYDIGIEHVTCGYTKQVVSTFGVPVIVDKTIDEVEGDVDSYDAIAIPGGFEEFGFYEEAYDERFLNLVREFNEKGKIIASICVAALPLGKSGILEGKKATTYHLGGGRRQGQLAEFGVQIVNEPVVLTGNIITSYCPQTAAEVGFTLLELLASKKEADTVREAMGYEVRLI